MQKAVHMRVHLLVSREPTLDANISVDSRYV